MGAEIDKLKKQVSGDASTKDTREFIDKLKETNKKKTDELEKLVDQLMRDKSKLHKENAELTNRNKKLKADFDKTLSEEKRELEIELDDIRMKGLKYGKSDDSSLQDQIGLQKTEIDLMKQEYEAEID